MKRINAGIWGIVAMGIALTSCGGKKAAKEADSDSALTVEQEIPQAGQEEYFLTRDSIGPVYVGAQVGNLPEAIPNLYNAVLPTETPDAMAYTYLLDDIPQFTVYDFMDGNVDVIALEGNSRGVQTPDGQLRVGDEFREVLKLPKVESEWGGIDEAGVWYWKWNGLYFGVDETEIPESLGNALCNGKRPPRASEFTPDVKIGYIATGLPF